MTELETKQQKIIVALFLLLGKAMNQLNVPQRWKVTCTETEIAKAWADKTSPIKIVSRWDPGSPHTWEAGGGGERIFEVKMEELDLRKVDREFASTKMPKADPVGPEVPEKSRVFILE